MCMRASGKNNKASAFTELNTCANECVQIFADIGAIEPLERLVSSSNALASRFAAQALMLMGRCVPNKLPHQVYLWRPEDVTAWLRKVCTANSLFLAYYND